MGYERLFDSTVSAESASAWRAKGKKSLGIICCHVPSEIFYAAGILPVRLRATGCSDTKEADSWMSNFTCSFARGILEFWLDNRYELDGMVASDGCLMASRIFDNAAYIGKKEKGGKFFAQIGAPRISTARSIPYYRNELQELISKLEEFSGNKITDDSLKEAVHKYNEARALIKQLYDLRRADPPVISGEDALKITMAYSDIPIDEYIAYLRAYLADSQQKKAIEGKRVRLMLIGSALDSPEYIKVIEDKGGIVVNDLVCYGGCALGDELFIRDDDVLGSIAEYYLNRLVCPRMMDNREHLHDVIIKEAREFGAQGVIYQKMQNCECWGGESVLLNDKLKDAGIPLLTLEREQCMINEGHLSIRAEAYIEMIERGN